MPGIQENHVHVTVAGAMIEAAANRLQFTPQDDLGAIQRALVEYAEENPGDGWIRGGQWGVANFPGGEPNKGMIDEVIPDRPVVLIDETVHGAWANSMALEIAGITADTPQPPSGVIRKDPVSGEPTGYLADGGMTAVLVHAPKPGKEQWKEAIRRAQEVLLSYGVVAVTDAAAGTVETLEAYNELESAGQLKMRVDYVVMLNDYMADITEPWTIIADRDRFRTRLLDAGTAKVGADGVPVSGASLLLEPYRNAPDSYGKMTATDEDLEQLIRAAEAGMRLMVHAIGDGTIRRVLEVLEQARTASPENTLPWQIAHPIWIHPDDIPRLARLNVVAEVSPPQYFWTPLVEAHVPVLGEERTRRAMPIRQFLDAGVIVSYGSDWPAGTPSADPWRNLEGMVTRMNPDGEFPGEVLGDPIGLEEALRIFTINGAIAMGHDDQTGTIEVGKYADMIVLDANPFELVDAGRTAAIGDLSVTRTLFEGEVVFDRE